MSGDASDLRAFRGPAAVLGVWASLALLGPWLIDPADVMINLSRAWAPLSAAHPLGCDNLGRDIAARLAAGAGTAFLISVPAAVLTIILGGAAGAAAGMTGRGGAALLGALSELSLAFPRLVSALALGAALGGGRGAIIAAFVLVSWPTVAQPTRVQTLSLRQEAYVQAAAALGASPKHVLRRHVLPGLRGAWLARSGGLIAQAAMLEAALGFLGLGVQEPQASWGAMLRDGLPMMSQAPALAAAAGGAVFTTALAVNLAADAAARRLDPRRWG
jgi:ABC-type dipeptide/oligopeptide/nickel transport system permease subunit